MSTLYVTEFTTLGTDHLGRLVTGAPLQPPNAAYTVAIGASSAQSPAFGGKTNFVQVHTDAICSIAIGNNPTAAATANRMATNETRIYGVAAGQKIAVITNS